MTDEDAILEFERICAEEATQHFDTSALELQFEEPHKHGLLLTDDYLSEQPIDPTLSVRYFTEEDFPHAVLPASHPEVRYRIAQADKALSYFSLLKCDAIPRAVVEDPDAFVTPIWQSFPDPDSFTAGSWTRFFEVWRHVLSPYRRTRAAVNGLLEAVRSGLLWRLTAPASQTKMPDHTKKLARLRVAAARQMNEEELSNLLRSPEPRQFQMPNHASAGEYPDFVRGAIEGLLAVGAAMRLPDGQRPLIINPLGVADNKAPKLRLILDPLYPNLLFKYEPLRYEQLADLTYYLDPEDWATTTDEKSGYHHMALHPTMWTLLGFQHEGACYVFTHLPFGVGPACKAYTTVKQEIYRLPRDLGGARLTFLIDDVCSVAKGRHRAAFQGGAIMLLQWALGFYFSIPKGTPYPTQRPTFLGMEVDIPNLRFLLPDAKILDFAGRVGQLTASAATSDRTLARLAGRLVSFAPAIQLSSLYAHQLFKLMEGKTRWDALYATPAQAVEAMQWVADSLPSWNGRTWACKRETLLIAGDYSSTHGYAAYTPSGELADPIVITLTAEELALIAENRHSSTLGEIKAVLLTLQVLVEQHLALVQGRTLHYEGDSQPAMASLSAMAGNAATFPLVRQVWELALRHDVALQFSWHPREDEHQQWADHWSKFTDNSQWALNDTVFELYIAQDPLVVSLGGITLDLFADHTNAKAERFYSRHFCPGTLGVNGFLQPWAFNQSTGQRELCYANGDFSRMGAILHKLKAERANCVVVYPDWPRYWQVLWDELPVRKTYTLPRQGDLCVPGPRVDRRKNRGRAPSYAIKVAVVLWD